MNFGGYVEKVFVVESSKAVILDDELQEQRYQAGGCVNISFSPGFSRVFRWVKFKEIVSTVSRFSCWLTTLALTRKFKFLLLGGRPMVGLQTLDLAIGVRVPASQPQNPVFHNI